MQIKKIKRYEQGTGKLGFMQKETFSTLTS
jgi:hypothetical protein